MIACASVQSHEFTLLSMAYHCVASRFMYFDSAAVVLLSVYLQHVESIISAAGTPSRPPSTCMSGQSFVAWPTLGLPALLPPPGSRKALLQWRMK